MCSNTLEQQPVAQDPLTPGEIKAFLARVLARTPVADLPPDRVRALTNDRELGRTLQDALMPKDAPKFALEVRGIFDVVVDKRKTFVEQWGGGGFAYPESAITAARLFPIKRKHGPINSKIVLVSGNVRATSQQIRDQAMWGRNTRPNFPARLEHLFALAETNFNFLQLLGERKEGAPQALDIIALGNQEEEAKGRNLYPALGYTRIGTEVKRYIDVADCGQIGWATHHIFAIVL